MNPDVVIIGGGIVGTSCAYYLAKAGVKVHLVERGTIGAGASKAGMCHIVTWDEPEVHLELGRASKRLYEELSEELPHDIEYRRTGSIAFVEKPESLAAFEEMVCRLQAWGIPCHRLGAQDLHELEPNLAPDISGGVFWESDAMVNPLHATQALAAGARTLGATIETGAEVTGIELAAGGSVAAVQTKSRRIPTRCVVNAAGSWSSLVGRMAGLDVPVTPRKGHLVVTVPVPEDLFHTKILIAAGYMDSVKQGGAGIAVAANVQQTVNGNLLLGSSRQFVGYDLSVEQQVITMMLSRCLRFFPVLKNLTAIRTWTGLRPYSPDLLPIIGPVAAVPGFHMASGHEGIGITEGPITGKLITQVITGQEPDFTLAPLALERFAQSKPS